MTDRKDDIKVINLKIKSDFIEINSPQHNHWQSRGEFEKQIKIQPAC